MRRVPVGPLGADGKTKPVELEGQWRIFAYRNFDLDASFKLDNSCTKSGTTLKFTRDGKETWVFVDATAAGQTGYRDGYTLYVLERAAMAQDIVANELLDRINKDGLIALYLNFDTRSPSRRFQSFTINDLEPHRRHGACPQPMARRRGVAR